MESRHRGGSISNLKENSREATLKQRLLIGVLIAALALGGTAGLSWVLLAIGGISLDSWLALAVYALTETGGSRLVPLALALAVVVWATDRGATWKRRRRESFAMFLIMAVALPTIALVNEGIVKAAVSEPRPSHRRLFDSGIIDDLEGFYRLDKDSRQDFLRERLAGAAAHETAASLALHPVVLNHWMQETGSTFPSGHALNAFIAAVFFLGATLAHDTRRRRWLVALIMLWAIAVSLSRVLLLVHRPLDVAVGASVGAVCGVLILLPWWRWTQPRTTKRLDNSRTGTT